MEPISILAPAKLNLFLAVTGRRADGFHDLVSVVVTLAYGDTLRAEAAPEMALICDDPQVPSGEGNLVMKAARAFAGATGWTGGVKFGLEKRIPAGAGLGGGSSDAVAALRALNRLAGPERALAPEALGAVAAGLGSDCPLFLAAGPLVMRGRGERVELLPEEAARRLRGRRVLVFKPGFGISTPWAYARLAAGAPGSYLPAAEAEARLAAWMRASGAPVEELLFNNLEPPAFRKFVALPVLLERLRGAYGLQPRMSGSGSACYAFLPDGIEGNRVAATVREAWGEAAFVVETRIA